MHRQPLAMATKFDDEVKRLFADNIDLFQINLKAESTVIPALPLAGYQDEDSELYGFAWIPLAATTTHDHRSGDTQGNSGSNESEEETITSIIRNDRNWENPAAISLMSKSFRIRDSFSSVFVSKDPQRDMPSSTTIKTSQDLYWAKLTTSTATVYIDEGMFSKALTILDDALELAPRYVPALISRCQLHLKAKRFSRANADIKNALQLDPTNEIALKLYESCVKQFPEVFDTKIPHRIDNNHPSLSASELIAAAQQTSSSSSIPGFQDLIQKLNGAITTSDGIDFSDSSSNESTSDEDSHSSNQSSKKTKKRKSKSKRKKKSKKFKKEKKSKHDKKKITKLEE